ncbi:single-stranded DNA-binding protein [uncultured Flavobacterium sp.]|uniref:single-stranded DNA-binding protein n=1 Tax=uncultured Flavobacterium sp. TaxID=165435 RepID=UPI0025928475|nr:single-stranded DNA-binding protein [uncultured Flavobacterium sp.]
MKNRVQLIGNLRNAAEVKSFESGKKVANFSLATSETYKNEKGEKITDVQWHNCVAWGKTAEIIEKYTEKGTHLAVEGKLSHRNYEDKNGEKRYVTEIVINEIVLLSKKN